MTNLVIDKVYSHWRFRLAEKTEQDAAASQQRGHFPLMWLVNFVALRGSLSKAYKVICAARASGSSLALCIFNTLLINTFGI